MGNGNFGSLGGTRPQYKLRETSKRVVDVLHRDIAPSISSDLLEIAPAISSCVLLMSALSRKTRQLVMLFSDF